MKIAAVVILYYPDENLSERLLTYLSFVEKLYIIDNSEEPVKLNNIIIENSNVETFADHTNRGIAERLNFVCKRAIQEGFNWLLTMDQDSYFDSSVFDRYLEEVNNFAQLQQAAMFGVTYHKEQTDAGLHPFQEVNSLITSGSIVNLWLFEKVGGFDEKLFIDEVDLEYCLRSIRNGFKIVRFPHLFLNHQLGVVKTYRSVVNFKQSNRTLHSPIRLYYMVRNYLYVRAIYKDQFSEELTRSRKALLNRIKNNLLYSNKRYSVLLFIVKGITDYQRHKMGKLVN